MRLVAVGLAVVVVAVLLLVRVYERGDAHSVRWTDVTTSGGRLEPPRATARVFRTTAELRSYLRTAMPGRPQRLPRVDLRRNELVLVAAGPRSASGYAVEILSVRRDRSRVLVTARERTPSLGDPVRAGVTYPYRLIAIPAGDERVEVHWVGRP
jgi:hypothetical protein